MLCNFLHIEHAALRKQKIEGDKAVGTAIIRRAVEAPLRTLADNAGQEGALIVQAEARVASKHLTFETDGTRSQRHAHEDSAVVEAPPAV